MNEFWENAFSYPLWVYITIPFGAAFVGWITKILALKMMFHPVEFKGIKPYLGWQGQIPKRAPKMAAVAVDSLTSGILKPEELFDKIDPDELVKELGGPLREASEELVDTIMMAFQPQVWRATPDPVKKLIIDNVEGRIPTAARGMFEEFRGQVDQIFDIKHMVVTNLVRDKAHAQRGVPGHRPAGVQIPDQVRAVLRVHHRPGPDAGLRRHRLASGVAAVRSDHRWPHRLGGPADDLPAAGTQEHLPRHQVAGRVPGAPQGGHPRVRRADGTGDLHPEGHHGEPAHRPDVGQVLRHHPGRDRPHHRRPDGLRGPGHQRRWAVASTRR